MEVYLVQFGTLAFVHFLVVITPGPDFALVASRSLLLSRREALVTALGVVSGVAIHLTYTLFGVVALLGQSSVLFDVVRWSGALYLTYLGLRFLFARGSPMNILPGAPAHSLRQAYLSGFFSNLLNPNVLFFFVALFTQIVSPGTPLLVKFIYATEILLVTVLWYTFVAYILSTPRFRGRWEKYSRAIELLAGLVLVGFGIHLGLQ
ncbi:MAG: hypothetical protein A2942_01955 [Candidatus Lloydbacteria bacterium RIFCSPLOWO2_01_FULL_50_20]|uniref:Lysine transporter LysE n=1 Tax=Candidatus Lloydbacteria bacterium RIFCSPLOWO2_01_FULL_50_20 TaxID=1798665 RepID=A0A1G2DE34_9BACT|nr:MAG: hypothetical protein A3C13_02660 [Candidatus Lloydbacteria bacterium RIFCSPHIGHO2_02_FULL_50_11]OGZ11907.1 MAG: hypothetical protein A2942_01955 [Candidatus Lloydbacteria bacterium RIFCSPLOWO2_01_FULL_50_20]